MKETYRTMIAIFAPSEKEEYNENGFLVSTSKNIFGEGNYFPCEWSDNGSADIKSPDRYNSVKRATLKMRYVPQVNEACKVYRAGEDKPWDIVSVENAGNRNYQLIVKVERKARTV